MSELLRRICRFYHPRHKNLPSDPDAVRLLEQIDDTRGLQLGDDNNAAFFKFLQEHRVLPLEASLHQAWAAFKQQQDRAAGKAMADRGGIIPPAYAPMQPAGPAPMLPAGPTPMLPAGPAPMLPAAALMQPAGLAPMLPAAALMQPAGLAPMLPAATLMQPAGLAPMLPAATLMQPAGLAPMLPTAALMQPAGLAPMQWEEETGLILEQLRIDWASLLPPSEAGNVQMPAVASRVRRRPHTETSRFLTGTHLAPHNPAARI